MIMMKVKLIPLFAAACALLLAMAACSTASTAASSTATSEPAAAKETANSDTAKQETAAPIESAAPATVSFQNAEVPVDAEDVTLVIGADEFPLLDSLLGLKSLTLDGSTCYAEILEYQESHPSVSVHFTLTVCGQQVEPDVTELAIPASSYDEAGLTSAVPYLGSLTSISFTDGTLTTEQAKGFLDFIHSIDQNIAVSYSVSALGMTIDYGAEGLDLCGTSPSKMDEINDALSAIDTIRWVCLNPDSHGKTATEDEDYTCPVTDRVAAMLLEGVETPFTWYPAEGGDTSNASSWTLEQVGALQQAHTGLIVDYPMSAFGISFSTADTTLTLSDIKMKNQLDTLRSIMPYMTNCDLVEMLNCGIGNEDMSALSQELAPVTVAWLIKCGPYTCRTDSLMIKFAGKNQKMVNSNVKALQYCTKCRYLDLGHNHLSKMDFVNYMPDLEVAIIAVNYINDCAPIGNCTKLEYLELLSGIISDISTLSNLTNLKHLNIAYNNISDISPLYGLTNLERAWISRNPYPEEQAEELQTALPNCEVNTTAHDPTSGGWRKLSDGSFAERYALLREQFVYDNTHIRSYYLKDGKIYAYLT